MCLLTVPCEMVRYPFFAVHFLFCHTFLNLRRKHKQAKKHNYSNHYKPVKTTFPLRASFSDSPITFLVKVAAALCAVLLVPLRLVQAVGGARPHLRFLGKDAHMQNEGGGKKKKKPPLIPTTGTSRFADLISGGNTDA